MLTSRTLALSVLATTLAASPALAQSQSRSVGLGAAAGIALPDGDEGISFDPAVNWGFFVDIPLIYTFHITPSTLLYRLVPKDSDGGVWVTDVSLNFKFMIPLGPLSLFGGLLAGLTTEADLKPHVGLLAGGSFNLISNIDVFVQANYKLTLRDSMEGGNIRNLQVYAGPLFRFH